MTLRNHITLVGSISSNMKVFNFENGKKVARFKVTTEKPFRANNGKFKTEKEWHEVFAWGNLAQFIESYGEKGKKVAIHGRLVNRTYLSPEGQKKSVTEVEVRHIQGL